MSSARWSAHRGRVAYIAVLGDQEIADGTLAVNGSGVDVEAFLSALKHEIAARALDRAL
ncbi:hypothetical protein [Microbacterium sp. NPDC056234]|uniref:hypothetical protein n=1 Tax=Microbacterium sp. NPDC056234 TaxID=3345757 RepID=UPI0035D67C17